MYILAHINLTNYGKIYVPDHGRQFVCTMTEKYIFVLIEMAEGVGYFLMKLQNSN